MTYQLLPVTWKHFYPIFYYLCKECFRRFERNATSGYFMSSWIFKYPTIRWCEPSPNNYAYGKYNNVRNLFVSDNTIIIHFSNVDELYPGYIVMSIVDLNVISRSIPLSIPGNYQEFKYQWREGYDDGSSCPWKGQGRTL